MENIKNEKVCCCSACTADGAGYGCLADNDQWVAEDARMNAGDRYTITFAEPGMWEIIGNDGNGNLIYYFFEVQG